MSAFQKLTSIDHVDGIIGGLWDFVAQPLFPLTEENKIAFFDDAILSLDARTIFKYKN